jgi:hypothetical protein
MAKVESATAPFLSNLSCNRPHSFTLGELPILFIFTRSPVAPIALSLSFDVSGVQFPCHHLLTLCTSFNLRTANADPSRYGLDM